MKKTFKRAGVAVLSMAMLLSMGAVGGLTASAAISVGTQCTVTLPTTPTGATYNIYQIAPSTLSNSVYTYSAVNSGFSTHITVDNGMLKYGGKYVADIVDKSSEAEAMAEVLAGDVSDATKVSGSYSTSSNSVTLDPGYYIVITSGISGAAAPILFAVNGDTTINISTGKAHSISLDKGIIAGGDVSLGTASNGSAGVTNAAGKLGDKVNHKIISDIPDYAASVTSVSQLGTDYFVTDTPSGTTIIDGTTAVQINSVATNYNANIVVGIDNNSDGNIDTTLTRNSDYSVSFSSKAMTVTLEKDSVLNYRGKQLVITYTAVIDDTAVSSDESSNNPNTNTAKLNYDNKLTGGGSEIPDGDKPQDSNNVYTAKVDFTKTFQSSGSVKVAGATFKLQRLTDNGTTWADYGETFTTDSSTTTHTWERLDAATYQIVETNVPAGYVASANKVFTIAESDIDASSNVFTFSGTGLDSGTNNVTMDNPKKDVLPGTGGMGTTLFTVGGAVIVLMAGFMFVLYIRKRKTEE